MLEERLIHQFVKEASLRNSNTSNGSRRSGVSNVSTNQEEEEDRGEDFVLGTEKEEEQNRILEQGNWWKSSEFFPVKPGTFSFHVLLLVKMRKHYKSCPHFMPQNLVKQERHMFNLPNFIWSFIQP